MILSLIINGRKGNESAGKSAESTVYIIPSSCVYVSRSSRFLLVPATPHRPHFAMEFCSGSVMCSMALDQQASIPVDVSQFHESIGCLSVSGLIQYISLIHFDLYKQLLRSVCILRISSSSRDLFGGKLDLSQDVCIVPVGADAAIPECRISYAI